MGKNTVSKRYWTVQNDGWDEAVGKEEVLHYSSMNSGNGQTGPSRNVLGKFMSAGLGQEDLSSAAEEQYDSTRILHTSMLRRNLSQEYLPNAVFWVYEAFWEE